LTVLQDGPAISATGSPTGVTAPPLPDLAVFRGGPATAPRTLVDILAATARRHPAAAALDDGTRTLTYRELLAEVDLRAARLTALGVGAGDRVGVRVPSGTAELYLAVLAVLTAGAAYVPVDADDPDERAELVFGEAAVCAVVGAGGEITVRTPTGGRTGPPSPADDAWIIFTSGSTGTPKGVAVSHASAAAFVDAEAQLFLVDEPIGPGDRVLAGLSVAFDASCEEMWLAWRHGACLVPAPRALVRTGMDLGPWLERRAITVVSTVPTLAALWPAQALDDVRLLIFGGEACPAELAERLAVEGREVWNTYGPTEATVVACGAQLTGEGPVRIGLPLAGWDLAVVDAAGVPVPMGTTGELVIGGVGLARYLDAEKDAASFTPLQSVGWSRAYRSGDLVRAELAGLLFVGRADEQVKLGGRRIELGEVDSALSALPGVAGAAAAVRTTTSGNQVLVGYVVADSAVDAGVGGGFDADAARDTLRAALPAALVPLLAVVDDLPTRTSGKVDRAALPWPLPGPSTGRTAELAGTEGWLARRWRDVLGVEVSSVDDDFFAIGGTSLVAAQLISVLRLDYPSVSVADLYRVSKLGALAAELDSITASSTTTREIAPTPRRAGLVQAAVLVALYTLVGLRWTVGLAALGNVLAAAGFGWAPTVSWWWLVPGWAVLISPPGRMAIAAGGARLLLRGLRPGVYLRGGGVHLRIWTAERLADLSGAANLAGAPWITYYARALGARIGRDVDLHSLPPITGMLKLGKESAIEPEVDLSGVWLDGDRLHVGRIRVGAGATVGARSILLPGARIGKRAEVLPGSAVTGSVGAGQRWAGSPARRTGRASHRRPSRRAPRRRRWVIGYGLTSVLLSMLPLLGAVPGVLAAAVIVGDARSFAALLRAALLAVPVGAIGFLVAYALLTLLCVRLLGIGLRPGYHPVHSRIGWQAWATERLMDLARVVLFPLYASLATPVWLRLLGARVGRGVEASTVLAIPSMLTVGDGAFLADDTMIGSYELGGGWVRVGRAEVGDRAFLGNSGMTGVGRVVPDDGLVAVLSSTPKKAKAGSSWVGMPPMRLRRTAEDADTTRTFAPPRRLRMARAAVELCRVLPVMASVLLAVGVLAVLAAVAVHAGPLVAALVSGLVLLSAGVLGCAVAVTAKWLLVGRFRVTRHPLWSSFVWRTELADTFVEVLAVPWLGRALSGTPLLAVWLRAMGASVGRGVWCETYWLPEADLVRIGDGATVNRGCVLQTHLFHDRIMAMAPVTVAAGATLGPHGIVLPGASVGERTTVGPASLVMRGDELPADTRWSGNPIASWV